MLVDTLSSAAQVFNELHAKRLWYVSYLEGHLGLSEMVRLDWPYETSYYCFVVRTCHCFCNYHTFILFVWTACDIGKSLFQYNNRNQRPRKLFDPCILISWLILVIFSDKCNYTRLTALFREYPGEPVPER